MKTKYDWSNVPKEVKWIATDSNKNVFGYYEKPVFKEFGCFMHSGEYFYYPHTNWMMPFKGDWQDSLEERPND